jgi:hypothetical protein
MKLSIYLFCFFIAHNLRAQKIITDSVTGSKIKGAKYNKACNCYIINSDSAKVKKAYLKSNIVKDKVIGATLLVDPNAPTYNYSTSTGTTVKDRIDWYKAERKGLTGKGVKVAVLDIGFDTAALPYYAYEQIGNIPQPRTTYHGTTTASIIKSKIGMANGVEIHLLEIGFGVTNADLLYAFNYCLTNNIDILNMSLALGAPTQQVTDAMSNLIANHCIIVAASGNSNTPSSLAFPASRLGVQAINGVGYYGDVQQYFQSYLPVNGKGIDFTIGGYQQYYVTGNEQPVTIRNGAIGTSLSAPSFAAYMALRLEQYGGGNGGNRALNYTILKKIKNNAYGSNQVTGNGLLAF